MTAIDTLIHRDENLEDIRHSCRTASIMHHFEVFFFLNVLYDSLSFYSLSWPSETVFVMRISEKI